MGEQKTVLICDDEASIRKSLRAELELWGYRVIEADDGPAGIETVTAERPDLLVLDLMMPTLNGDHVCRELKGDPATRDLPIVMLTAVKERTGIALDLDEEYLPADRFIDKPPDMTTLKVAVEELLGGAD